MEQGETHSSSNLLAGLNNTPAPTDVEAASDMASATNNENINNEAIKGEAIKGEAIDDKAIKDQFNRWNKLSKDCLMNSAYTISSTRYYKK